MPSNHQEEASTYGGQSFQPFEYDETVEPDLYDGDYELVISDVQFRMSNPDKETGVQYPQLQLEWKATETYEESEECRRSVGNTVTEFLTIRPKGDRKGNMSKQRLTQLRNRFGIESDVIPARIQSPADFDDIRNVLKGQTTRGTAANKVDKTGQNRTNINIAQVGGVDETEEVEETPARSVSRPPARATKPAARKSARR
jgi:hypothetical protein